MRLVSNIESPTVVWKEAMHNYMRKGGGTRAEEKERNKDEDKNTQTLELSF